MQLNKKNLVPWESQGQYPQISLHANEILEQHKHLIIYSNPCEYLDNLIDIFIYLSHWTWIFPGNRK